MGRQQQVRPGASSADIERRMKKQRRRDTKPEMALRSELWRRGLRYRVDFRAVGRRRRVDIAFTRAKIAVFVDGCFWHRCPDHASLPKANRTWWIEKLEANERRDRDTDRELVAAGWLVIRVWEHEDPMKAADRVEAVVRAPRSGSSKCVDV